MTKSKNNSKLFPANITLSDFIGSRHDYHFIAVNTQTNMPAFSRKISDVIRKEVSYIGDYIFDETEKNPRFAMCYAAINPTFDINLIILENKTTRFEQNFIDKSEKNKGFHTLSLFDDIYYIFNRNGIHLYTWELLEVDYILIIFANKGNNISDLLNQLMQVKDCKCENVTETLMPSTTSASSKKLFIHKLLYNIGMKISSFQEDIKTRNFVSDTKLSDKNISYEKMVFAPNIDPLYLDYLQNDQTYQ